MQWESYKYSEFSHTDMLYCHAYTTIIGEKQLPTLSTQQTSEFVLHKCKFYAITQFIY